MFSVFKAEHTSFKGPTFKLHVMEEEEGGATGFLLYIVAKQALDFHRYTYWLVYINKKFLLT